MREFKTDESLWDYADKENFLVIPITSYVRKDGSLVLTNELAKEAAEKFADLQKRWGYFIENGVSLPTYRRANMNLMGIVERKHYASKPDKETVEEGLYLLNEASSENPSYVFYMYGLIGGEEFRDSHEKILTNERIILLEREKDDISV